MVQLSSYSKTSEELFNVRERQSLQRNWVLAMGWMVWWKQNWTFWLKRSSSCLEESWDCQWSQEHHPYHQAWRRQHHGVGLFYCPWYRGPGELYIINGKIDSFMYRQIREQKLRLSARKFYSRCKWIFQQDNSPKHMVAKLTKEWFTHNKISVPLWSSQLPDLNPI